MVGGDAAIRVTTRRGTATVRDARPDARAGRRLAVRGAVAAAVAALLGYAYYAQYVEYLDPCPLCITQRAFYLVAGVAALAGTIGLRRTAWQKVTAGVGIAASLGGLGTAARQVWLQHLPPERVPECGPGLQYWLENMPLVETAKLLFRGDGNCAEVDWTLLGLSMAGWSIVMFSLLLGAGAWLYRCGGRPGPSGEIGEPVGSAAVAAVRR